jgi:hypothetical protein
MRPHHCQGKGAGREPGRDDGRIDPDHASTRCGGARPSSHTSLSTNKGPITTPTRKRSGETGDDVLRQPINASSTAADAAEAKRRRAAPPGGAPARG